MGRGTRGAGGYADAMAAAAVREATELDAADFADLCVDTGDRSVRDVVRLIRARAGQWPQLPANL
jgi:hypothetical protein